MNIISHFPDRIRRADRLLLVALIGLIALLPAQAEVAARAPAERAPNILIIVADDLGYTDLGSFGGEIPTPNLDRLALEGLRFSNFHTYPTCAPTRASLMTGVDNHVAGIGSQVPTPRQAGRQGYEGHLNDRVVTLAEILGPAGYHTYLSGKWHLGTTPETGPGARGFRDSFALLPGGASHFSDALPLHPAEPAVYLHNGKAVEKLPGDFYSTVAYTNWLLSWLERDAGSGQPFFAYLAYTAPHDPLQAPKEAIRRHRGKYDLGWERLREKRFEGLKAQGLIEDDGALPAWPASVPGWDDLSAEERALRARDMEIYAAMIDILDAQVGRVIDQLEESGELERTWIFFLSDNGANGLPVSIYPTHTSDFHAQFDNSLPNRGAMGSFVEPGSGWATASTAAFRLFKGFSTEGGIRTPAFVRPPGGMGEPGKISDAFVHVMDLAPSIIELAGQAHPSRVDVSLAPLTGRSILPMFGTQTAAQAFRDKVVGIGYELHGTRAFIRGDWKIIQMPLPIGSGRWELYNLSSDPGETTDLARKFPGITAQLKQDYAQYRAANGIIDDLPAALKRPYQIFLGLLIAAGALFAFMAAHNLLQSRRPIGQGAGLRAAVVALAICEIAGVAGLFSAYSREAAWLLTALGAIEILRRLLNGPHRWRALVPALAITALLLIEFLRSGYFLKSFLQGF